MPRVCIFTDDALRTLLLHVANAATTRMEDGADSSDAAVTATFRVMAEVRAGLVWVDLPDARRLSEPEPEPEPELVTTVAHERQSCPECGGFMAWHRSGCSRRRD